MHLYDEHWFILVHVEIEALAAGILADMRRYMPPAHRGLIGTVEAMPSVREFAERDAFNGVLDAMADFRDVHLGWAEAYISRWCSDPRGTGGTPYMRWLRQLIDETLAYRIP